MALISIEEIADLANPSWNSSETARATMLLAGVLGWVKRNAPCLTVPSPEPHLADEANMIIAEAILRAVGTQAGSNVASEGIGPSSVSFVDRTALPTLTLADEAALIELCPAAPKKRRKYGTIRTAPGYLPSRRC